MKNRAKPTSIPERDNRSRRTLLGDTDLFFFFLRGGRLEVQAEKVVKAAENRTLVLRTSSETYDDAFTAIRADGISIDIALEFVSDMKSIPHVAFPMSAEIAEEAMGLYRSHGGRRRLSYFDSFHVATAKRFDVAFLTSDRYVLENSLALGVEAVDLEGWA